MVRCLVPAGAFGDLRRDVPVAGVRPPAETAEPPSQRLGVHGSGTPAGRRGGGVDLRCALGEPLGGDGFRFRIDDKVTTIRFALQIDGAPRPMMVEVGRENWKPGNLPLVVKIR